MYIEISPDIEYTQLPAVLLDGNAEKYDNLQLRYLDGGVTLGTKLEYKTEITYDSAAIINTNILQFNYKIPNSSSLAVMYDRDGNDITKCVYLDGNIKLWDVPFYPINIADGNVQLADGNLPSETILPVIRTTDSRMIDLSSIKSFGTHGNITLRYPLITVNEILKTDGGIGEGNIFVLDGMIINKGPEEVILHSNLLNKQTIGSPLDIYALLPTHRTLNIPYADEAIPLALDPVTVDPETVSIDSTAVYTNCTTILGTEQFRHYIFPKMSKGYYYSVARKLWLEEDDLIVVGSTAGTHVVDSSGRMVAKDLLGLIVYDPGPRILPYKYKLLDPRYIGINTAVNDKVMLERTEARLKGIVLIDSVPNWCTLDFYMRVKNSNSSEYVITTNYVLDEDEFNNTTNHSLVVMKEFNKKLTD